MGAFSQSFQINSKHRRAEILKPAANWHYLIMQISTLLLTFTAHKYIYPSAIT